jgi:hypothetical protein
MSWAPPPREPWVAHLNALGRNLGDEGRSLVPLDESTVLGAARTDTGLDDFGDDWFRAPLAKLLAALEGEARLTLLGRSSRAAGSAHPPEPPTRRIGSHAPRGGGGRRAPIFVTGLGRGGATLLSC